MVVHPLAGIGTITFSDQDLAATRLVPLVTGDVPARAYHGAIRSRRKAA